MLNKKSIDLIKSFEGLELKAYKDAVGVWTIGYGHTSAAGEPKVTPGLTITEQQAEDILQKDLVKYVSAVDRNVKVPINENQRGALASFTYNLGEGSLKSSTLLRKLNAKDYEGAAEEFPKWNKAGGKVLKGLVRRRAAEKALFLDTENVTDAVKPVPAPEVVEVTKPSPEAPVVETTPIKKFSWIDIIKMIASIFFRKK